MSRSTTVRMFRALLAAGGAVIAGAFWTVSDPGPLPFLLTWAWQVIFIVLALLLLMRGRP